MLALQIIYQIDTGARRLEEMLDAFWESQGFPEAEVRGFTEELVRGVLEYREEIDDLIQKYSQHWSPGRMAVVDRNILRLAIFEILHRREIPPKVTINEFVEIAKKFSTEESGAFVNGILDRTYHESGIGREKSGRRG